MKMKGIKTKIYQLKNICTWSETLFKWYDKWSKLSKRFEKDYQKLKSNNKSKKMMTSAFNNAKIMPFVNQYD